MNEDVVVTCGPVVAVFDGVSPQPGVDSGCRHGVAWYVNTLARQLERFVTQEPYAPLPGLLGASISATAAEHGDGCDLTRPGTPAAAVCLVQALPERLDYLIMCDTSLIVDDGSTVTVLTDHRFEQALAPIRADQLHGDWLPGSSEAQERLLQATRRKQALTNRPGGYWIAAADPQAVRQAVTGSLPLTGSGAIRRVALLTDGASRAAEMFGLLTWEELLDLVTERGPAALIRLVRDAEATNPQVPHSLAAKEHDDATVALCRFPVRTAHATERGSGGLR